ncbi:MAG TPA: hypothetical protein VNQ79_24680 [Blastocatellia bacterium]|nr:hypothetical protein [Blastocatellia bacterium]
MKLSKLTLVVTALVAAFIVLQIAGSYAGRKGTEPAIQQSPNAQATGAAAAEKKAAVPESEETDLPVKEEIHQTYELAPGARVEITGISGSLEIETAETQKAEVHIIRSAHNQATLSRRRTCIEHKPALLFIGRRDGGGSLWDLMQGHDDLRVRARLRLPRRVRLGVYNVSGAVRIGEVDDSVAVGRVSGNISLAQAVGAMELFQISGEVKAAIRDVDKRGIRIRNINGPVEVRFTTPVNADLEAADLRGGFNDQGMNVVMTEKRSASNFNARIGTGGVPVILSRINGSVTLVKATKPNGSTPVAGARVKTEVATARPRPVRHL